MSNNTSPVSKYAPLGKSGLKISKIIVGTMKYGKVDSWGGMTVETNEDKIMKILKKCYDSGLRTFDTACNYNNGYSEILLRKFIKKYNIKRNRIVILSKCFFASEPDDPAFSFLSPDYFTRDDVVNSNCLSRKNIIDSVEASVERLGTYMDVLQIHRYDPNTPSEEIMKALNDCVEKGYTRYIGASSMRATEFAELQFTAEKHGWAKFVSMQNYYHLLYREEEREMIPFCKKYGIGLIPWSPNAHGVLTHPASELEKKLAASKEVLSFIGLNNLSDADKEIINRIEKIANDKKVSMAAISTAWVLAKGAYPIVGLTSEQRVDQALDALSVEFTDEELNSLEELYTPRAVAGYR